MQKLLLVKFSIIISLSIFLASCAIFGDPVEEDETLGKTDLEVLQLAESVQSVNDWPRVIKIYEAAERRFPNSRYAPQFKLNLAYAYKEFYQDENALAMLDKFIRSYPNHPAMDYAYYLKGVVLYVDKGIMKELTFQDISDRDVSQLEDSFRAFKTMTQLFPNSEYFDDAKNRMTYLMNKIAERELHVARYYMRREAFIAAANRCKYVLDNFPETVHQEEALVIQISAYRNLGLQDLAENNKRVLELNFPNSQFSPKNISSRDDEKKWWEFWDL